MTFNFDAEKAMFDFEKTIDNLFNSTFGSGSFGIESLTKYSYPKVNLEAYKDKYLLVAEMGAGLKKEDVKVQLKENVLTISGTCSNKRDLSKVESFLWREIKQSSFTRSFKVVNTDNVNFDKMSASFEDGWLLVTLPKKEKAKVTPTDIPIN